MKRIGLAVKFLVYLCVAALIFSLMLLVVALVKLGEVLF